MQNEQTAQQPVQRQDFNLEINDGKKWEAVEENAQIRIDLPHNLVSAMNHEKTFDLCPLELRLLKIKNFGCHQDIEIDFTPSNRLATMTCLVGPNGFGKTTILEAIQTLFMDFRSFGKARYEDYVFKRIRNWQDLEPKELATADFLVSGVFYDGKQEYQVDVTRKNGFTQHPAHVLKDLPEYCFAARFDQELHQFQVKRKHWDKFKALFEKVTGFEVDEDVSIFDDSMDPRSQKLMAEYVTGFTVKKPRETIKHRQCSAGERKIAKCFSTILNRPAMPRIILIDNVTDHVENGRHIPILEGIEECFNQGQNIVTCHSMQIQRNLNDRSKVIDLRFLYYDQLIKTQTWRVRMIDELYDLRDKLIGSFPKKDTIQPEQHILIGRIENTCKFLQEDGKVTSDMASLWLEKLAEQCYKTVSYNYAFSFPNRVHNASVPLVMSKE